MKLLQIWSISSKNVTLSYSIYSTMFIKFWFSVPVMNTKIMYFNNFIWNIYTETLLKFQ